MRTVIMNIFKEVYVYSLHVYNVIEDICVNKAVFLSTSVKIDEGKDFQDSSVEDSILTN